jgi:hypothetical protein
VSLRALRFRRCDRLAPIVRIQQQGASRIPGAEADAA